MLWILSAHLKIFHILSQKNCFESLWKSFKLKNEHKSIFSCVWYCVYVLDDFMSKNVILFSILNNKENFYNGMLKTSVSDTKKTLSLSVSKAKKFQLQNAILVNPFIRIKKVPNRKNMMYNAKKFSLEFLCEYKKCFYFFQLIQYL